MATVTLIRATKTLKVDLTNPEFLAIDHLIQTEGPARIETALRYLIREEIQTHRDVKKRRIEAFVKTASDDKLDELDTIVGP